MNDRLEEIENLLKQAAGWRQAVMFQQNKLIRTLDKKISFEIPEEQRTHPEQKSLEFRSNEWTIIHQAVTDVLDDVNKKEVGFATVLALPVEVEGLEAILWYMQNNAIVHTISVPVARLLTVLHGVLEVVEGSQSVLKQLRPNRQLFTGNRVLVPAGERIKYCVVHNVVAVTKFIYDLTDPGVQEIQAMIKP